MYWAFVICQKLGIDDPLHWMNATDPKILDQWIAFESVRWDREHGKTSDMQRPEDALEQLMRGR